MLDTNESHQDWWINGNIIYQLIVPSWCLFKTYIISQGILMFDTAGISRQTDHVWIPQDFTDDKSTFGLVRVCGVRQHVITLTNIAEVQYHQVASLGANELIRQGNCFLGEPHHLLILCGLKLILLKLQPRLPGDNELIPFVSLNRLHSGWLRCMLRTFTLSVPHNARVTKGKTTTT